MTKERPFPVGECACPETLCRPPAAFACVDTDVNGYFSLKDTPTTGRWWLEAYRHAERDRKLPAGPEFGSERFTLAEPGRYQFKAQLDQADSQHQLKIE